jgi:glutathione reductase (NADPH)
VLGHGAPDLINVFALAIARGLTGTDLRALPWAYPTATSDLKHMLADPEA